MKAEKGIMNIVILLEAVIFVVVLIFALVHGLANAGEDDETVSSAAAADESISETEAEEEETEESSAETESYEEDRLTFSDDVEALISSLSTEELIAQLFVTTPEELTGHDSVTAAGDATEAALTEYPVGGLIYSSLNFQSSDQTSALLSGMQSLSAEITGIDMFLIVEETGGEDASPLASANGYTLVSYPLDLAEDGDEDAVTEAAQARAGYLADDNFNMVLAPVADIASGEDDEADLLCYGSDTDTAALYVAADITAVQAEGISAILKAFPGVNSAASDYAVFEAAIEAGVSTIMVSDISDYDITGDDSLPCYLSSETTAVLRQELGFDGILMSADISGEETAALYSAGEAAVMALQAGMNLIYITDGFEEAYEAVLEAVESGDITLVMLENSVGRILTEKVD